MLHSFAGIIAVPACLEYVEEAHQVAVDVARRIVYRIPHAGLRRQIDDDIRMPVFEHVVDQLRVRYRSFYKRKLIVVIQYRQTCFLKSHIIIVVHVIKADYRGTF